MSIDLGTILLSLIVLIIAIAVIWWILSKLYQRSTTDLSFVRTGFLGQKVGISGGAFVIPVLHEVTRVNMNTIRISLSHSNEGALITQDRLRLNVDADFYVRVRPEAAYVAAAARTLGSRTTSPEAMRDLLDARFTDALRTAAAELAMEVLHENRGDYARRVRELASLGLDASGLEIDSVSISKLDQASREFFNPNNAFDAAGLTKLTSEIEERRRRRNEIERDAQVAIQRKNLDAERQMLELQREEEYARLSQEREIAIRRAQQQSEITVESAELRRSSQVAEVGAGEAVEKARLAADRQVREEKIRLEQELRQLEIVKVQAVEIAETERRRALEIAQQEGEIAVAEHSKRRNTVRAEAEVVRAQAVKAEEAVVSARELERAERDKALSLVGAAKEIEARGMATVRAAESELQAAGKRAEMIRTLAEAESQAERSRQDVAQRRYEVEAEGRRALNEADNLMSEPAMALRAKLAAIDRVESVVRESAKPLEHISDIRIVHVDGLGGGAGASGAEPGTGSVSDQVMNSALKYKLQAPLVEALLESAGMAPRTLVDEIRKPSQGS